ncbi:MAG: hypothetical protein ACWGQW_24600, partial [bacterium]
MASVLREQTNRKLPEDIRNARDDAVRQNRESIPTDTKELKVGIVDFPKDMIIHRALLVTGAPRSGTRAIAHALTCAGFPIGHERSGPRGISSSFFAVNYWYYPGVHRAPLKRYRFSQVWHQTRDPLKTISSMADEMPSSWWHWQEKHSNVPGDLEPIGLRCALFWMKWSFLVQANHPKAWQYRIEDANTLWPEICDRLGIPMCKYT